MKKCIKWNNKIFLNSRNIITLNIKDHFKEGNQHTNWMCTHISTNSSHISEVLFGYYFKNEQHHSSLQTYSKVRSLESSSAVSTVTVNVVSGLLTHNYLSGFK